MVIAVDSDSHPMVKLTTPCCSKKHQCTEKKHGPTFRAFTNLKSSWEFVVVHPKMSIFVTHLSIHRCEYLQWKHVLIYNKWTPKKYGSWNQIEGYATTHVYTIGIIIAHYGNPYETASLKLDVVELLFCSKRITQKLKYKTSRSFSHTFSHVFPCLFPMLFPMFFCDPCSLSPLENCGPKFPRQHAPKGNGCRAPPPPPPATGLMGDILRYGYFQK